MNSEAPLRPVHRHGCLPHAWTACFAVAVLGGVFSVLGTTCGTPMPGEQPAGQGVPSLNRVACWDTNGDGVGQPEEDLNHDGKFDALDCRGIPGATGPQGIPGQPCWDLNGNGVADLPEDTNHDGKVDADDCQGEDGGGGPQGIQGLTGPPGPLGATGPRGAQGLHGADGADGADGDDGVPGTNGADGAPGANGTDGAPGAPGADGMNGNDGAPGADGAPGPEGPPGPSSWTLITDIPLDFADGVDNDTTYTAGAGLALSGTEFSVAADGIVEDRIADGAVTEPKLADHAVTTQRLADAAVTADKLADGSITDGKLVDGVITEDKLADNSVTEFKLADAAVIEAKLADGAVTADKIAAGAITASLGFTPGTGTITEVAAGAGLSGGGTSGTVTVQIADNAVGSNQLADAVDFGDGVSGASGQVQILNAAGAAAIRLDGATGVVCSQTISTAMLQVPGGCDLAEAFELHERGRIRPGMVLTMDAEHPGRLRVCDTAYDKKVAGVVSGAGGLSAGIRLGRRDDGTDDLPVALSGRVYCLVDATTGAIDVGDLLTTCATRGHAMKATDRDRACGAIIGKAMQPLSRGKTGLVLVLVSLQ